MRRSAFRRYSWPEMRRYWETHDDLRANVDWSRDPDALDNVCHTGAPTWLNAYYARGQRAVFAALLSLVPEGPGRRALDVGCGAGRWCRVLHERGYDVTGIDLQSALIARISQRYPAITFHCCSLQEYAPSDPRFDLLSSVTVLQHLPFAEQPRAIERMRALSADGGHAIVLENVRDQAPHVFSHSIADWVDLFAKRRFQVVAVRRYDYSPMLRAIRLAQHVVRSPLSRLGSRSTGSGGGSVPAAERAGDRVGRGVPKPRSPSHRALRHAQQAAIVIDSRLEGPLASRNARLPAMHAGFLFRAV